MSRSAAKEKFVVLDMMEDLKKNGVFLGAKSKAKTIDECRWAYKSIDEVID